MQDPFGGQEEAAVYVARPASEDALGKMELALAEGRGLLALHGPPGIGKSMLLRVLAKRLERQACCVFPDPDASAADDLFMWIVRELDARETLEAESALGNRSALLKFREWMRREWRETDSANAEEALRLRAKDMAASGFPLVALIDDADSLLPETVQQLASLSEGSGRSISFVLALTAESKDELDWLGAIEPAPQIVDFNAPMNLEETTAYVPERLRKAGAPADLLACIDGARLRRIHAYSQGVPRRVHGELSLLHIELTRVRATWNPVAQSRTEVVAPEAGNAAPAPEPAETSANPPAEAEPIEAARAPEAEHTAAEAEVEVEAEAEAEAEAASPAAPRTESPEEVPKAAAREEPAELPAPSPLAPTRDLADAKHAQSQAESTEEEAETEPAARTPDGSAAPSARPERRSVAGWARGADVVDRELDRVLAPAPEKSAQTPPADEPAEHASITVSGKGALDPSVVQSVSTDWEDLSERSKPLSELARELAAPPGQIESPEPSAETDDRAENEPGAETSVAEEAAPQVQSEAQFEASRAAVQTSAWEEEPDRTRRVQIVRAAGLAAAAVALAVVLALGIDWRADAPSPEPASAPALSATAPPSPIGSGPQSALQPAPPEPRSEPQETSEATPAPSETAQPVVTYRVNINAIPYATIEIDGVEAGETPLGEYAVESGVHQFRARMPDGEVIERTEVITRDGMRILFP